MSSKDAGRRQAVAWLVLAGFVLSIVLAGMASYYANPSPDGLEAVAEQQGFLETAEDSPVTDSPLADYDVAGIEDERASVGLAGVAGVAITAVVAYGLFIVLRVRRRADG